MSQAAQATTREPTASDFTQSYCWPGTYRASSAGFVGPTSKERGKEGRKGEGEEGRGVYP